MEVTFEVDKTKTPYHTKPYRISIAHVSLIKRVINEIVRKNSLAAYNCASEWVALTFCVPKKNDGVRIVTNFRKLNDDQMQLIADANHSRYVASMRRNDLRNVLDMIMSYYAMNIRKSMRKYVVIILPWGK